MSWGMISPTVSQTNLGFYFFHFPRINTNHCFQKEKIIILFSKSNLSPIMFRVSGCRINGGARNCQTDNMGCRTDSKIKYTGLFYTQREESGQVRKLKVPGDRGKRLHQRMACCACWFVRSLSVCCVTSWTLVQGQLLNLDYGFFPLEPRDIDLYIWFTLFS